MSCFEVCDQNGNLAVDIAMREQLVLLLKNLDILNITRYAADEHSMEISWRTFTLLQNHKKASEVIFYALFQLYDAQECAERLQMFPCTDAVQSKEFQIAVCKWLGELKKLHFPQIVVRRTTLQEPAGERYEDIIYYFSSHLLHHEIARSMQSRLLKSVLTSASTEELQTFDVVLTVWLQKLVEEKGEMIARYSDVASTLRASESSRPYSGETAIADLDLRFRRELERIRRSCSDQLYGSLSCVVHDTGEGPRPPWLMCDTKPDRPSPRQSLQSRLDAAASHYRSLQARLDKLSSSNPMAEQNDHWRNAYREIEPCLTWEIKPRTLICRFVEDELSSAVEVLGVKSVQRLNISGVSESDSALNTPHAALLPEVNTRSSSSSGLVNPGQSRMPRLSKRPILPAPKLIPKTPDSVMRLIDRLNDSRLTGNSSLLSTPKILQKESGPRPLMVNQSSDPSFCIDTTLTQPHLPLP